MPTPSEPPPLAPEDLVRARRAWPEVSVPDGVFARYVAERSGGADATSMRLSDLYLACACSRGDADAMASFDRTFLAPLPAIVARAGSPPHLGTEVTQTLRERLLVGDGDGPRITEYSGHGALAGWLRIAAIREASKAQRHERVHSTLQPDEPPLPATTPEEETIRARYGDQFNQAFRDAFQALAAEDRLMLRLHFAEGLNLDRLAMALGFSRATAGRRMLAVRGRLRDETLRLLGERLAASPDEVASVLAALRSRLEVTFASLVGAA